MSSEASPQTGESRAPRSGEPSLLVAVAVALAALAAAACEQRRDPIILQDGVITIENQTGNEWKNVRVVVNDYFGGSAPSLGPGQRMNAVLSNMQTGFGQRFDRSRMSVYKIEVTATDDDGEPVRLKWGEDRQAKPAGQGS